MTDQEPTTNGKDYWRGKVDTELKSIKESQKETNDTLEKIDKALRNGGNSNPGLISQVREITRWKGKIEKFWYGIIVFIILDVATRFLNSPTMEQLFHNPP